MSLDRYLGDFHGQNALIGVLPIGYKVLVLRYN